MGQVGKNDINSATLWWAGPLTVVVSVLLVFATRAVAFALVDLPADFPPLTYGGLAFFTVMLVGLGVLVFVGCAMWSAQPISLYRRIALGALVLSMVPDALLPGNVPGATWPAAIMLMIAHVAAWAPTVFILTNRALVGTRV
ncbi:MAG TPA: DUF6069 family protein [Vicinamibacterales bacterium]|nr:DUF6069 family protein [Vicinamibacterales bacterium]